MKLFQSLSDSSLYFFLFLFFTMASLRIYFFQGDTDSLDTACTHRF